MDIVESGKFLLVDTQRFAKLSPNDRRELMAAVKRERRILVKENLKDAGITGPEYFNEMDAFDQSVFGDWEFFQFLQSIEGRAQVIERAAQKANGAEATKGIMEGMVAELEDDFPFAAKLAGVKIEKPDPTQLQRTRFIQDLKALGFSKEESLAKLMEFDTARGEEPEPPRPLDAGA